MIKNKKQMFIVIGLFTLLLFLGGTTYAWFTYRRETGDQELVAGEIYLHLNEGQEEIELTNIFPETAQEARSRNDNFITFTVDGKNTSNKTIYYEIILDHGADKASPKTRYRDEDLRFDLVALNSNGDEDEYLLSAVSYETLTNRRIYVDTVNANTTTELERGYKLRMWLDENVVISDTAADKVYTTTEYPNKYATVKLIVAGDFGEKTASKSLYTIMRETAVMDNTSSTYVSASTGINFGAISSDTNGKGIYMRAGTENDTNPIMYYRGAVEDNNVFFANKCWKAVRTTDTGGVKLIYNGNPKNMYEIAALSLNQYNILTNTDGTNNDVWTFDATDNSWNASCTTGNLQLSFNVPAGDGYILELRGQNGSGSSGSGGFSIYKGTSSVNGGGGGVNQVFELDHSYGTLTATDVVKFTYSGGGFTTPSTFKIRMTSPGDLITSNGCDNSGTESQITMNNAYKVPFSYDADPVDVGYMYGNEYTKNSSNWTSGARFGSGFTWDGTNYTLVDDSVTTPNATHHYSCNVTTANGTCTQIRYVYYVSSGASGTTNYYITITGGDGVEEALIKMKINTTNSNAKDKIDTWYLENMTGVTNKLEDTIWCNDRSFGDGNNNGWIANGGDLSTPLYYGAYQRSKSASNSSTVKNQPSLVCVNKNDAFTVSNGKGNQALTYPVALLTADEMVIAGGVNEILNESFYLTSGEIYWTMSPSYYDFQGANLFNLDTSAYLPGYLSASGLVANYRGIRPSVSLKSSTQVASGTGIVTDPYVIE